jgi:hypothetical protein
MSKVYTAEEVAQHRKEGDLWVVIDSKVHRQLLDPNWLSYPPKVYDLSKFAQIHPGGVSVLVDEDVGTSLSSVLLYASHKSVTSRQGCYRGLFQPAPTGGP